MQISLNLNTGEWYIRGPQAGSATGWSAWVRADRQDVLCKLELGHDYIKVEGVPAIKVAGSEEEAAALGLED